MNIGSKAEFYRLWEAGVLGNRPHLFHFPCEAYNSRFPLIGFRELGKAGGGKWERVERNDVFRTWDRWMAEKRKCLMDSATSPANDSLITLQGEVCRTYRGLEGFMGYTPGLPMRQAFPLMRPVSGSEILVLWDRWMDPSSQDDIRMLLDLYPEATIEFTCFTIDTGCIPGRNTILWESRCY